MLTSNSSMLTPGDSAIPCRQLSSFKYKVQTDIGSKFVTGALLRKLNSHRPVIEHVTSS